MGLFSKPKLISGADALAAFGKPQGEPLYAGWVMSHQPALQTIANQIGWKQGDSQPVLADLKPTKDPNGKPASEITIAGQRIGYLAAHPQQLALVTIFEGMSHKIAAKVYL